MQKRETRKEIEARINLRAWKDPAFKEKLLKNPRPALAEMGLEVPSEIKILVHEEGANMWHLTIHKAPPNAKNLSEEELKKLSSGSCEGGICSGGPINW